MGNARSSTSAASCEDSKSQLPVSSKFKVYPRANICSGGSAGTNALIMQFAPEAITFHDSSGVSLERILAVLFFSTARRALQKLVRSFAYHVILCWGHNEDSFQFRFHPNGDTSSLLTAVVGTTQVRAQFLSSSGGLRQQAEPKQ